VSDPLVVRNGVTLALIDGNPLPQAPEWTTNLTARYGIPLANDAELYVYTDWAYRSAINFFLYESEVYRGRALLEGGLRLGYSWELGRYEVAAFGRNILDRVEAVGGIDFNNLTGFINEPRTWGVESRPASESAGKDRHEGRPRRPPFAFLGATGIAWQKPRR
jgi:iron complex outermembrane receptor protein